MPIPNALVATTAVTLPLRREAFANICAVIERLMAFIPLLVKSVQSLETLPAKHVHQFICLHAVTLPQRVGIVIIIDGLEREDDAATSDAVRKGALCLPFGNLTRVAIRCLREDRRFDSRTISGRATDCAIR